jgi:CIC family chloride channel protein
VASNERGFPRQAVYLLRWLILSLLIGALAGTLVWVVQSGISRLGEARTSLPGAVPYILPVLAGLIVGLLIHRIDPAASGEGAPTYIKSVQNRGGYLESRTVVLYMIGTVLTLGLGGSGGFVGPACLYGGGAGSFLFRKLRFLSRALRFRKADMRLAMVCGAGAGVAAALDAPIGGGIFAVEVLYAASIEYEGLFPGLLASITGYTVHSLLTGFGSPYRQSELAFGAGLVPGFILTAIVVGILGIVFVMAFKKTFDLYHRLRRWGGWRPVAGACVCAVVGLGLAGFANRGQVLGPGTETFRAVLDPQNSFPVYMVALLLFGKIVATVSTVGMGNPAGLTGPVLMIGAMAGSIMGSWLIPVCTYGSQSGGPEHAAFIAVGMAGMLAAVLNVPIAAVVIMMEVLGTSYALPAALGSITAFSIARSEVVYKYLETEP